MPWDTVVKARSTVGFDPLAERVEVPCLALVGDVLKRPHGEFVVHRNRYQSDGSVVLLFAQPHVTARSPDRLIAVAPQDFHDIASRYR